MIGARIATLRRSAGYSQQDLARCLQISPSTVGMYEQGRREPSLDILVALSELLNVSIDYLVTGRGTAGQDGNTAQKLLEQLTHSGGTDDLRAKRQELAVLLAALLMES